MLPSPRRAQPTQPLLCAGILKRRLDTGGSLYDLCARLEAAEPAECRQTVHLVASRCDEPLLGRIGVDQCVAINVISKTKGLESVKDKERIES